MWRLARVICRSLSFFPFWFLLVSVRFPSLLLPILGYDMWHLIIPYEVHYHAPTCFLQPSRPIVFVCLCVFIILSLVRSSNRDILIIGGTSTPVGHGSMMSLYCLAGGVALGRVVVDTLSG